MAIIFDSVGIKGMRRVHFIQLMAYIDWWEKSGQYYGNKNQFKKRHSDLKKWMGKIISHVNQEGIIIPTK